MTVERELKFEAGPDVALPDLTALAPDCRVAALPPVKLEAAYYDTADLRLARWGATLRHRPEGLDDATPWTVKFAALGDTPELRKRHEVSFADDAEAAALVRGLTRGEPLVQVARLVTRRVRFDVVAADDTPLAEVDDDEVVAYRGRKVVDRFREIEVELAPGADDDIARRAGRRLRKAGAMPASSGSKLLHALTTGREPLQPEIVVPDVGRKATVVQLAHAAIATGARRVIVHDPGVRLDADPEAVHQARVGTRRLRSDIKTFAAWLDPAWTDAVRTELSWLADALGEVRDADVLGERLAFEIMYLNEADRQPASRLLAKLHAQREAARERLLEAMADDRYVALLDTLVDAAERPPVAGDDGPGAAAMRQLVEHRWKQVGKAHRDADDDAGLHALRIVAKRARYATEAASPVLGGKGTALAKALAGLQTVLGDLHDAVVREAWLRTAVQPRSSPATALAAGLLVSNCEASVAIARADWPKAWDHANEAWRALTH